MLSKNEIKLIKSLENKKFRKKHNFFVIEGERIVKESLVSGILIDQVFISESFVANQYPLIDTLAKQNTVTKIIPDKQMKAISGTVTPSGILALVKMPVQPNLGIIENQNILYLDTIQDPGNLGTLLRSANWFGIENIILSENSIDPYNPKVVRSGMGAHFNLNIFTDTPLKLLSKHTKIGGFQEGESIYEIEKKSIEPWVLVIGNEAYGISEENAKLINKKITIPKIGKGESLNVAVAGSVLLYHLTAP